MEIQIKSRPIIFSGEMIRAILAGRKSMTRRVIKPQPESQGVGGLTPGGEFWYIWPDNDGIEHFAKCPYGKPGSRLWVRETFRVENYFREEDRPRRIYYRADQQEMSGFEIPGWTPSIFMPRWASRITLEVTGVRVERLNQISEADCIAEGIPYWQDNVGPCFGLIPGKATNRTGYAAFARLWNSINLKRGYGWDSNPFVWCISFKVVQP